MTKPLLIIVSDLTAETAIKFIDWVTAAPAIAAQSTVYLSGNAMAILSQSYQAPEAASQYLSTQGFRDWATWLQTAVSLIDHTYYCPTWLAISSPSLELSAPWQPMGLPVVLADHSDATIIQL